MTYRKAASLTGSLLARKGAAAPSQLEQGAIGGSYRPFQGNGAQSPMPALQAMHDGVAAVDHASAGAPAMSPEPDADALSAMPSAAPSEDSYETTAEAAQGPAPAGSLLAPSAPAEPDMSAAAEPAQAEALGDTADVPAEASLVPDHEVDPYDGVVDLDDSDIGPEPAAAIAPEPAQPSAEPASMAAMDEADPSAVASCEPTPVDPEPLDPEPLDPEPLDPEPLDPEPLDPEPMQPGAPQPAPEAAQPSSSGDVGPISADPAPPVVDDAEVPPPSDAGPSNSILDRARAALRQAVGTSGDVPGPKSAKASPSPKTAPAQTAPAPSAAAAEPIDHGPPVTEPAPDFAPQPAPAPKPAPSPAGQTQLQAPAKPVAPASPATPLAEAVEPAEAPVPAASAPIRPDAEPLPTAALSPIKAPAALRQEDVASLLATADHGTDDHADGDLPLADWAEDAGAPAAEVALGPSGASVPVAKDGSLQASASPPKASSPIVEKSVTKPAAPAADTPPPNPAATPRAAGGSATPGRIQATVVRDVPQDAAPHDDAEGVTCRRKRRFTLRLTEAQHLRMRLASVHLGQSAQKLVMAAVDRYLSQVAPDLQHGKCLCMAEGCVPSDDKAAAPPSNGAAPGGA